MKTSKAEKLLLFTIAMSLAFASIAHADPSIEDVFKSTQDAMGSGNDIDGRKVGAVVCAVIGLIVVIAMISKFKGRAPASKSLNHQGKLLKELQREIGLKPAEIRQLKAFVEQSPVENPLTLMLCPSLLTLAAKSQPAKIDRRAFASLAKRIGNAAPAKSA